MPSNSTSAPAMYNACRTTASIRGVRAAYYVPAMTCASSGAAFARTFGRGTPDRGSTSRPKEVGRRAAQVPLAPLGAGVIGVRARSRSRPGPEMASRPALWVQTHTAGTSPSRDPGALFCKTRHGVPVHDASRPGRYTGTVVRPGPVGRVDSRSGYCAARRSLGTTRTGHGATCSSR